MIEDSVERAKRASDEIDIDYATEAKKQQTHVTDPSEYTGNN